MAKDIMLHDDFHPKRRLSTRLTDMVMRDPIEAVRKRKDVEYLDIGLTGRNEMLQSDVKRGVKNRQHQNEIMEQIERMENEVIGAIIKEQTYNRLIVRIDISDLDPFVKGLLKDKAFTRFHSKKGGGK